MAELHAVLICLQRGRAAGLADPVDPYTCDCGLLKVSMLILIKIITCTSHFVLCLANADSGH